MNEEQKFDELINSKLSEREFPFDELNWDEAERLIIRQERWAKIRRVSLVFSAGLALGVAAMLPFVLNNRNSSSNSNIVITQPKPNQNAVVQNSTVPTISQPDKDIVSDNKKDSKKVTAPLPVQSAFVKKDNSTGIRAKNSGTKPAHKKIKALPIFVADDNSGNHPKESKADYSTKKPITVASTIVTKKKTIHKKVSEPVSVNKQVANSVPPLASNNPIPESKIQSNSVVSSNDNNTVKNNSVNNNTVTSSPASSNEKTNTSQGSTETNSGSGKSNTTANTSVTSNSTPPKMPVANSNGTAPKKVSDTNNAAVRAILPGTEPVYVPVYSANILSAYIGGNYSFGWHNNGAMEGNGLNKLGGFIFTHYFSQKIAASIGLGYSELNNLNKTYTSSIIQYDFGQNANITTVTPTKAIYLDMPVSINYTCTKNIFSAGFNFLWLLTTSSKLTTYQQSQIGETAPVSMQQDGYSQGFNNLYIQFTLAYTRMITERLGVSPQLYFGLNYIENSSFPGINQYDRNSGVRLVLSYQLMK